MCLPESERVLVVPTEWFHRLGYFQGFAQRPGDYVEKLLEPSKVVFRPRAEVEHDPAFKQLIPYVIFCCTSDRGEQLVFRYTRGTGQGEGRLHRKRSIGVGGHISTVDAGSTASANPYEEGLQRELAEEVEVAVPFTARCVGLINDDQTEVGRVHLGIVHRVDLPQPAVRPRESDLIDSGFCSTADIFRCLDEFETWSQICARALFGRPPGNGVA